jgi:hypothetical protein
MERISGNAAEHLPHTPMHVVAITATGLVTVHVHLPFFDVDRWAELCISGFNRRKREHNLLLPQSQLSRRVKASQV